MKRYELIEALHFPMKLGLATILYDIYNLGVMYKPIFVDDDGSSIIIELESTNLSMRITFLDRDKYVVKTTYYTDVRIFECTNAKDLLIQIKQYLSDLLRQTDRSESFNNSLEMMNLFVEYRRIETKNN